MPESKYSILIVDDESAQRQMLAGFLGKDYSVVAAMNAAEATQLMSRRQPEELQQEDRRSPMWKRLPSWRHSNAIAANGGARRMSSESASEHCSTGSKNTGSPARIESSCKCNQKRTAKAQRRAESKHFQYPHAGK